MGSTPAGRSPHEPGRLARLDERLMPRRMENWRLLRRLTDEVGAEVERWSDEDLDRVVEEPPPIVRPIDGHEHIWQVECWTKEPNGRLQMRVDCDSRLPTPLGGKPSYVLWKHPDGSVTY